MNRTYANDKSLSKRIGLSALKRRCSTTIAICTIASLITTSCTNDYNPEPTITEPVYVNINATIPREYNVNPITRNGTPTPGLTAENEVKNITFIIFNHTTGVREVYKRVTISAGNIGDDPMWNASNSTLRIPVTPGQKRIYTIANWTNSSDMPNISSITDSTSLINIVRAHPQNSALPLNPPVMSGRTLPITITGGETNLSVQMTRQVSRVEIYPMRSGEMAILGTEISVEGVRFTSIPYSSYLFSRGAPPVSPNSSTWDQTAYEGISSGNVTATTTATANLYKTVYIPEYIGIATKSTGMVVKAKIGGVVYYYTIVLNGQVGAAMRYNVQRNHSYAYYITFQGAGSTTAAKPSTNGVDEHGVPNIKVELEIKNQF